MWQFSGYYPFLPFLKHFCLKLFIHPLTEFVMAETDSCFVQQEDDSDCGGGTLLSPCLWPLLGLQLLLLWLLSSSQLLWPPCRRARTLTVTLHKRAEDTSNRPSGTEASHFQGYFRRRFHFFRCQRVLAHVLLVAFKRGDALIVLSCTHTHLLLQ